MLEADAAIVANAAIVAANAIVARSGIGFPPPAVPTSRVAFTQVIWTGTATTVSILAANTYYRIAKASATQEALPQGIVDNNDLSFTNNTGTTQTIAGRIVIFGEPVSNIAHNVSVGTDNSGSDAAVLTDSGYFRVWHLAAGNLRCFVCEYQVDLLDGKTVFPIVQNDDGAFDFEVLSGTHKLELVA